MAIYLLKNNEKHGPFEESTIAEWLRLGRCSPDDLAWREGMVKWQPLQTFYLTPYIGQAGGGDALMFQDSAQPAYSTQPPARIKWANAVGGFLLMAIGGVGCALGVMGILSGIGIVVGLPLLFISLPIILLGVVLVRRS